MNRTCVFLLASLAVLTLGCKVHTIDPDGPRVVGTYTGTMVDEETRTWKRGLSFTINGDINPVSGTYSLKDSLTTTTGKVSGTVWGAIIHLTFTPSTSGPTYTFNGTADVQYTTMSGIMTGIETTTPVQYLVDVKR